MAISEIIDLKARKKAEAEALDLVTIGLVRKTVGLNGWLRIALLTDYPDRFQPGTELTFKNRNGEPFVATVEDWRDHFSETAIEIKLEGVDDCDEAAKYVNTNIVIPKNEREELEDDEFYPDEFEGMAVFSPEGKNEGKVIRFEAEAPCPYLDVKLADSTAIMIPFRKEFISSVDKKNKTVRLVKPVSFHIPVE
jgi:16S rRNA processing protein RimM